VGSEGADRPIGASCRSRRSATAPSLRVSDENGEGETNRLPRLDNKLLYRGLSSLIAVMIFEIKKKIKKKKLLKFLMILIFR